MTRFRVGQTVTIEHGKSWKSGRPIHMRGRVRAVDGDRLVLERAFRHPGQEYDSLDARQQFGDYGIIEIRRGGLCLSI